MKSTGEFKGRDRLLWVNKCVLGPVPLLDPGGYPRKPTSEIRTASQAWKA